MTRRTEKELDKALDDALQNNAAFVRWFLSMTKFSSEDAEYHWSRVDHPWGKVKLEVPGATPGSTEIIEREGETDVLAVFQTSSGRHLALHIENKLAGGRFRKFQPELYAARAASWSGDPKYKNYDAWETMLVAPRSFQARFPREASKFDRFVAHEELATFIKEFGTQT